MSDSVFKVELPGIEPDVFNHQTGCDLRIHPSALRGNDLARPAGTGAGVDAVHMDLGSAPAVPLTALRYGLMDVEDVSAATVAGEPASEATVVAPPVSAAMPELAWSQAEIVEYPQRRPWRLVLWRVALIVMLSAAGIAAVLVLDRPASIPAPAAPSSSARPSAASTRPAPPMVPGDAPGTQFLFYLDKYDIDLSQMMGKPISPASAVELGRDVCGELHRGQSAHAVADQLYRMMPRMTEKQAANLVSAAQMALCSDTGP